MATGKEGRGQTQRGDHGIRNLDEGKLERDYYVGRMMRAVSIMNW